MRALSKADLKPSRANMHGAASLWKEKQTLSLPPTCTQLVLCEKGKFSLDGSFSKNAPYKQKIIFHLTSIGKMSKKFFFFPWTVHSYLCLNLAGKFSNFEGTFGHFPNQTKLRSLWEVFLESIWDNLVKSIYQAKLSQPR